MWWEPFARSQSSAGAPGHSDKEDGQSSGSYNEGEAPQEEARESARQILLMAGWALLARSSKGKRPVSSWCAMTPADHTSEAGTTAELSTSGAMYLIRRTPCQPPSAEG